MRLTSKKGGIILRILAVLALILLILSIEVPKKSWEEQAERRDLARTRMIEMSDCEVVYMQETGSFDKDLKKVFDFAYKYDSLKVGVPEIEIEILDIDSTKVRLSFTDVKHFKDLNVIPDGNKELENIENKQKFIEFMESINCPTPELVMESGVEEIELLLKENPKKDFYRSLKEKYYKSSENETEILYNAGQKISVTLLSKNPNLNLKSNVVKLSSNSNIEAIANYKSNKDIFWDFVSKDKIKLSYFKDPALEVQSVNMAKYVFSDIENDKTPYLCPSTLEQFKVSYNLSAQVGMSVTFFRNDLKDLSTITKGKTVSKLPDNTTIMNYFLSTVKLKAERKVTEMVREYEMDGDSTYSNEKAKADLFSKFFAEQLKELVASAPLSDEVKKTIDSPDSEKDKRFSQSEMFNILFDSNPGEIVAEEIKKPENKKSLSEISFFYKTEIIKTETTSVRIESPINENSAYNGYKRGILQNRLFFGVEDDENAGYVDNGTPSWKSE